MRGGSGAQVYGAEAIGPKSHVLSDWAQQCAARHHAASLTDGTEVPASLPPPPSLSLTCPPPKGRRGASA
eukprot:3865401-Rhodomonas_salina.1